MPAVRTFGRWPKDHAATEDPKLEEEQPEMLDGNQLEHLLNAGEHRSARLVLVGRTVDVGEEHSIEQMFHSVHRARRPQLHRSRAPPQRCSSLPSMPNFCWPHPDTTKESTFMAYKLMRTSSGAFTIR